MTTDTDRVIEECAVALVYNGISHVVMMVTPTDLAEFALGFSLTEGILEKPEQLLDFEVVENPGGLELQLTIAARQFQALKTRRRNLTGRTGCGLCGAESLQQAMRYLPCVSCRPLVEDVAIDRAVRDLRQQQGLQQQTGAAHAAAWCDLTGSILLLREDVGRHNALDKLIGVLAGGDAQRQGFVIITSRASYEMVQKVASVDIGTLVAVSAPTALAIGQALDCGVRLLGFTRPGRHVDYTGV